MKENKNIEAIKAYEDLVKFFSKLGSVTKDENLASISKKYVEDFNSEINDLNKTNVSTTKEDETIEKGENITPSTTDNTSSDSVEEPVYMKYVNSFFESDYGNVNVRIDFQKLINQLLSDLKNPNDKLIETWINNYIDFINRYDLNEELMFEFIKNKFETTENAKKYVPKLEELFNKRKAKTDDEKNTKDDDEKNTKDDDESKTETDEIETDDIETEKDDIKDETKSVPLKIVSTKHPRFTRPQKLALGVMALCCIFNPVNGIATVMFPVLPAFMIYKLYKDFRYRHRRLDKFLERNDMNISKDGKLIDESGNEVTENLVGKARYRYLKRHLMRMGAMKNKMINFEYIKNKLTSLLLGDEEKRMERKNRKEAKIKEKEELKEYLSNLDYFTRKKEKKKGLVR